MKNFRLLLGLFFFVCLTAQAQKIKLKKGEVLVDGVMWLKYDGCGGFDSTCSLLDSKGEEELIFIKSINVEGAVPSSPSNSKGILYYEEIIFVGTNQKIEIESESQKGILEILYKGKVVSNDKLDPERVSRIVEKYGTPVSDKLNQGYTNTIIIKEEPKKSGININIGG